MASFSIHFSWNIFPKVRSNFAGFKYYYKVLYYYKFTTNLHTAWKVPKYGVFSVQIQENADQKNFVFGHFSLNDTYAERWFQQREFSCCLLLEHPSRKIPLGHCFSLITEAVVRRFSVEKAFLEISQNLQESTCGNLFSLILISYVFLHNNGGIYWIWTVWHFSSKYVPQKYIA